LKRCEFRRYYAIGKNIAALVLKKGKAAALPYRSNF
jgi:hypothetical protein